MPLCKIATDKEFSKNELVDFFLLLDIDEDKTKNTDGFKSVMLSLRLIKHAIYNGISLECLQVIEEAITQLVSLNEIFVEKFCTDLYLRHKCDYINIPEKLFVLISESHTKYCRYSTEKPLVRLLPIIISPLEAIAKKSIDSIIDEINAIAMQCEDAIECRWCITAWMRISPLREYFDGEVEFANELHTLIQKFDKKIIERSSLVLFFYLTSFLRSFIFSKDLTFLAKYEQEFSRNRSALLPPQITLLQLEYASCIYIFCQHNNVEAIAGLKIAQLAQKNENLLSNALFKNILIPNNLILCKNFSAEHNYLKRNIFKWVVEYTKILSQVFAKPLIEKNHLNLKQFKASLQVYQNRHIYVASTKKSLESTHKNLSQYTPSFCARSCFCFDTIGKNNILLKSYIERALLADDYAITRSANHIARGLYVLRYYDPDVDIEQARKLEMLFSRKVRIGASQPKLFWLYYATTQLKDRPVEQHFLEQLIDYFDMIYGKYHQLKLRRDEEVTLKFPDAAADFIKKNATESLIAGALSIDLTNPEAWNHLGTAVFDNMAGDVQKLKAAANFYTAAKCFAREKKEFDKKYCYNYIRSRSIFYDLSTQKIDLLFANDTVHYLMQPEASFFYYSDRCVLDFFNVVKRDWRTLDSNTRQKIKKLISEVGWIKKDNQSAQDIMQI